MRVQKTLEALVWREISELNNKQNLKQQGTLEFQKNRLQEDTCAAFVIIMRYKDSPFSPNFR